MLFWFLLLPLFCVATSFPDWPQRLKDKSYLQPQFECRSPQDCMFLGTCSPNKSTCVCNEGFTGSHCQKLDLLPIDESWGFQDENFPSWGGMITKDKENYYHLFVSYLVNKCDLFSYATNSAVLRATSRFPQGPYRFANTVLGPFHHGTVFTEDDSRGELILFTDGNRDIPSELVHDCRVKPEPFLPHPAHQVVRPNVRNGVYPYGAGPHDFLTWTSLDKAQNWTILQANQKLLQTNLDEGIRCNRTNPSPWRLKDGSTMLALRTTYCDRLGQEPTCPLESDCQHQHIYLAKMDKELKVEPEDAWIHVKQLSGSEDPFLWVDSRTGYLHLLVHSKLACGKNQDARCLLLASSRDGVQWQSANTPAFQGQVRFRHDVTKSVRLELFQRPKIFFDVDGTTPLFLIGGVRRSLRSKTQTMVIPFNVQANRHLRDEEGGGSVVADTANVKEEEEEEDIEDEPILDLVVEVTEEEIREDDEVFWEALVLGLLLAPIMFALTYLCLHASQRVRGYRMLRQVE